MSAAIFLQFMSREETKQAERNVNNMKQGAKLFFIWLKKGDSLPPKIVPNNYTYFDTY